VSSKVHACLSLDTFAEEIVEPVATRVFARSPFAYGHEAEYPDAEAATWVAMVRQPELAAALLVALLPPHAATSDPAAISRAAMSVMRPRELIA
jgi:hypothetical protein